MADVLVVSHSSELAGAERSLVALVTEAVDRGHDVTAWVPAPGPLVAELTRAVGPSVRLRTLPNHWWMSRRGGGVVGAVRLLQVVADVLRMLLALRGGGHDVVLVNSSVAPAAIYAAALRRLPVVTVVRESVRSNPTLVSLLPRDCILGQIARWSREVVTVSEFVAGQFGSPSVVISPPVSATEALAGAVPRVPVAGSSELRLVMAGTIGGDKGQGDAVAAVDLARRRGARVSLDIFGAGAAGDVRTLRTDIERRGLTACVTVHGPVSDMDGRWSGYDASVVTARNEAYGRVTVESLLAGTPVLGFARGGTVELLAAGGGVLVEPTPHDLAEAMTTLAGDRSALGAVRAEARRRGETLRRADPAAELVDLLERVAARP